MQAELNDNLRLSVIPTPTKDLLKQAVARYCSDRRRQFLATVPMKSWRTSFHGLFQHDLPLLFLTPPAPTRCTAACTNTRSDGSIGRAVLRLRR